MPAHVLPSKLFHQGWHHYRRILSRLQVMWHSGLEFVVLDFLRCTRFFFFFFWLFLAMSIFMTNIPLLHRASLVFLTTKRSPGLGTPLRVSLSSMRLFDRGWQCVYSFKLTALAIGIFSENSSFLNVFTDISSFPMLNCVIRLRILQGLWIPSEAYFQLSIFHRRLFIVCHVSGWAPFAH